MKKLFGMIAAIMIAGALFAGNEGEIKVHKLGSAKGVKAESEKPVKAEFKPAGHVCYKSIAFQAEQFTKEKKYDEALKLYNDAKTKPEYKAHMDDIYSSIASINNQMKKYDENIKLWKEGHKKGVVFGIDPTNDQYRPYKKMKGFREILKKETELKAERARNPVPAEDCGNDEKEIKMEGSKPDDQGIKKLERPKNTDNEKKLTR